MLGLRTASPLRNHTSLPISNCCRCFAPIAYHLNLVLYSTLRIYAQLLQTQAQKFAASETMRTACSTGGCHRYRSKGILERAEFINVPARPG